MKPAKQIFMEVGVPMSPEAKMEHSFRAELRDLLFRYDAEISAEDHWQGYPECGEDVRMTVTIPGEYDPKTGETIRSWMEIDLGRFQDGKPTSSATPNKSVS